MNDFPELISEWQTFYLMVGTTAATLIGLLFVAVSLHINVFHRKTSADLHHFAALTFNCFFYVLLISILFLIPKVSSLWLGIPLLFLAGLGLMNTIIQRQWVRMTPSKRQKKGLEAKFNVPMVSLVGLFIDAVGILLGLAPSLYGLILVIILLLISASLNAWSLLIQTED